jgi:aldehyde dehydrogenase (NAD+)
VVVKANEMNPFSTLFTASLAIEAGIPPGVINCVTGDGAVGMALAKHMAIRKISFTGGLAAAREVQVAAARSNLKSVTLQLGGKSPIIVFPDADLDKAAKHCGMFLALNGQGCTLGTRVYIHKSIFAELLSKIESMVRGYEDNLGLDPLEDATWSSPLFHHRQRERVLQYIEQGEKEATLLRGGEALEGPGCYMRPAIFLDPLPDARILKEEVFGPVLMVLSFEDDDEVLRLANDSEYGLRAYVWTKDLGRAFRFTNLLEAGCVGVNEGPWSLHTTYGGWKRRSDPFCTDMPLLANP